MSYASSWVAVGADRKVLRKDKFLREMEVVIPFDEMREIINPIYTSKS